MSEHENNHEDIARRLRTEGQATAPPDLMPAVMAEVRTEPRRASRRRRSLPNWRPLTAWAAAAATLVAIGYGISHVGGGTSSSSGSSSAAGATHAAAGEKSAAPAAGIAQSPSTFTVEQDAAKKILGTRYPLYQAPAAASGNSLTPLRIRVPANVFRPYATKLAIAQRHLQSEKASGTPPRNIVIIKLIRAHAP